MLAASAIFLERRRTELKLLIKNGHLIDPATERDGIYDVLINDGIVEKVEKVEKGLAAQLEAECDKVIDAEGLYVMPGFIDLHVHFREPGLTHKETVKTGSEAAAAGGYTSVFCMPNTKPVIDSVDNYELLMNIIKNDACVNVYPVGAVTKSQQGKELAEISAMAKEGMKAISEDGKSVMDSGLYRQAMKLARKADIAVFAHCEDINLVEKGVINAGKKSAELGFNGISNAVEDIITARDIMLAKETGARLHLCHCSTKDSVTMVKEAKEAGVKVTAEVCPHHFTLTDEDIPCDDANYKMNPPLRTREDVDTLIAGIRDGIMEVISTDHAPHSFDEKNTSIEKAPFGIVGLETAFALSYSELVLKNVITLSALVKCMSTNPAKVAGIDRGSLAVGKVADIAIVDLDTEYTIDPDEFKSMGKNTPFGGRRVQGKVVKTLVAGVEVYGR